MTTTATARTPRPPTRTATTTTHGHAPHESPWVVAVPLVALAIPSVVIGGMTISSVLSGSLFKDGVVFDVEKHPAMEELAQGLPRCRGHGHARLHLGAVLARAGRRRAAYLMYIA